jgi:heme ABC exporter ATP-binding subunit CcmA
MVASMAPAIRLRSAVALQGRFPVLSGVDLDLGLGQVLVVLGANGAGKTSLLRLLAGLVPLTSGEAEVLGADLRSSAADVRRRVGLLGHDAGLHDELTALENLRFALRASRLDHARAEGALERVGLGGRPSGTPLGRLSAGQRRRVGLALLVARRPQLWLLDEPHASLDEATRSLVAEVVEEAAVGGAAVVASSHEPELAIPMADLVATMAGGAVVSTAAGGRRGGSDVA